MQNFIFIVVLIFFDASTFAKDSRHCAEIEKELVHQLDIKTAYPITAKTMRDVNGNLFVPNASKAKTAWANMRGSTINSNQHFLWAVSDNQQQKELAGFMQTTVVDSKGYEVEFAYDVGKKGQAVLKAFYRRHGRFIKAENLGFSISQTYEPIFQNIREKYKLDFRLTKENRDTLKNGSYYYFIDETGKVWMFFEPEIVRIFNDVFQEKYSAFKVNHSSLYQIFLSKLITRAHLIDYGKIEIETDGKIEISRSSVIGGTRMFNTERYLHFLFD